MTNNLLRRWINRLHKAVRSPWRNLDTRAKKSLRLELELLEDRLTPAAFTSGDLAVVRVGGTASNGGGSSALADTSTAAFIDEYTTAGVYVQTIVLPTAVSGNNNPLTLAGNATGEGQLNLSTNGQFLLLAGFDATTGVSAPDGSSSSRVTIGEINATGGVDTSTAMTSGDSSTGGEPRSAFSTDGTTIWLGENSSTSATGGVRYINGLGATVSTNLSGTALKNARDVQVFNGQLYFGQDKVTAGGASIIEALGSTIGGSPVTTSGQSATPFPGSPLAPGANSKTNAFFLAKVGAGADFTIGGTDTGFNTIYITDSDTHASGSTLGIAKYSWNSGTSAFVADGNIGTTSSIYESVTGTVNGSTVTLYATNSSGLVQITDNTGFGGSIAGITPTVLHAFPTNTAFLGVAFVPTATTLAITGLPASTSFTAGSSSPIILSGGSAKFANNTLTSSQLNASSLSISITNNGDNANDILGITNQGTGTGQIGVSGSNVTYTYTGGTATTIGSFTGGTNGNPLVITFDSSNLATSAAVQALINEINFKTNSSSSATRTVQFTYTPSAGNGSAVNASENVNIALQTPTINAGSAITLGENHAAYSTTLTGINDGENDGNANVTSVVAAVTGGNSSIFATGPSVTYTSPNSTASLNFTLASNLTGVGSATITVTVTNSLNNTATAVYTVTVNAITVTSTGAAVPAGKSATITSSQLSVSETGVTAANIQYTLTGNPPASAGTIDKNGVPLGQNSTFTQADINNNLITYVSTGSTSATDNIGFSIADLTNGGSLSGQTFSVSVIPGIIAEWTFPTIAGAPDNSPAPNLGTGTAITLGMTNSYNGGNTANDDVLTTAGTVNPNFSENTWRIRGTPHNGWATFAAGAPQYSQGIELDTSTAGYSNIVFSFDWYSTTQGIRDLQVQYNTDTTNSNGWTNYNGPSSSTGDFIASSNDYYNAALSPVNPTIHIDFSTIHAANNNAHFGVRLVSAFDSTGHLGSEYASAQLDPTTGVTIAYNNSSGNWRFGNLIFAAGITTTTAVTASPTESQNYGHNVTFTATVTPASGSQYPSGTVAFYDGNSQIGTTQIVQQVGATNVGTASITLSTLTAGIHGDITAQYSPTPGNNLIASGSSMNLMVGDPTDNPISYTINAPQATGVDVSPVVGQSFSGVVATFSDGTTTDPTGFTASIDWGDGHTSDGVIAFSSSINETNINGAIVTVRLFTVTGTNTYTAAGSDSISVTITDPGNNSTTVNPAARVAYPPLLVTGVPVANVAKGTTLTNQTVATFTDPGLVANLAALGINDPTTQFSATIKWGDNSSIDAGTITYDSGTHIFSVVGSHTYTQTGPASITVTVTPMTVSVERSDSSDPNSLNEVGDENGNGITDSPSAEFIDQFVIGAANQAGSLYTFSLPTVSTTTGNRALTTAAYSRHEGALSLSTNGQYLVTGGYNLTVNLWGPQSTFSSASVINRVIGRIDGQGNIDTTTALTDAYSGDNFRDVASTDGMNFWTAGHATAADGLVHYAQFGQSPSTILTGPGDPSNINTIEIFNGHLFEGVRSVAAGAPAGIYQIDTGLPTTSGQSQNLIIQVPQANPLDVTDSNKPTSPSGLFMADLNDGNPTDPSNGENVAYIADSEMGIARYDYNGSAWQFSYYINSTGSFLNSAYTVDNNGNVTATNSFNPANPAASGDSSKAGGVRELTGRIVNGQVQLFAATGFGTDSEPAPGGSVIAVADTGASAGFTTLATDSGKSVFTGVAFTPYQSVTDSTNVIAPPTANAQSVTLAENTANVPITLTGSDPNNLGLSLTYNVTVSPTHGTLSGTAPNLSYTPYSQYFGTDSFQFTVNNGYNTSTPATVSLTVNLRPFLGVAAGDADSSSAVLWTRIDKPTNTAVTAQVSTDVNFGGSPLTFSGTSDSTKDFTVKLLATGLNAATTYFYRFVIPSTGEISPTGTFKTAPAASSQVALTFAFSGDMDGLMRPYALSSQIPAQNLDFYANLGDVIYETASNSSGNLGEPYLNSPSVTVSGSSATLNGVPVGGPNFATQAQLYADYNQKYQQQFLAVNVGGQADLSSFYAGQGNYTLLDNHELGNRQYINGGAPAGGSVGGPNGNDMPTGRGVDARANGAGNPNNVNDVNTSASDYMNRSVGYLTLQQDFLNYEPIRENRANPALPSATISAPTDPRTDGTKQLYFAQPWGENAVYIQTDTRSYRDLRLKTANGSADDTGARADNPNRTYLGATQLAWLEQQLLTAEQNGTPWKFVTLSDPIDEIGPIGSSLPGVTAATMQPYSGNAAYGPVNSDGGKSYIGGYRAERNALLKFIADNKIENVVFLATDDHQNRINEVTYSPTGDTGNQASYVKVPHVFSIVCGPLGATGPDLFLNHDFASVQGAANLIANAQIAAGVEPIGLMGYTGLHNVMRDENGVLVNETTPQAVDFYSPDTFNYNILQVSADGKTLTVTSKGIKSTAQNAAAEYGANGNTVHTLFSFQVDAFNEAPVATASSVTTNEDTARTFTVSDFHFTDVENNSLASIKVSAVTLAGGDTLTVNQGAGAVAVTNGMTITAAQIATLTYTPAANASGPARSTFNFTVNDAGLGTVSATMTINVTAVADTPNLSVAPAFGVQGVPIPLSIQSSLNDTDGSETLSITISGVPAGASLNHGSNQGGGIWILTPAQLAGLTITVPVGGNFSLHVVATAKENANNSTASASADLPVAVAGANLINGDLYVFGTSGADNINVNTADPNNVIIKLNNATLLNPNRTDGKWMITNQQTHANPTGTHHVIVFGYAGADTIQTPGIVDAEVHGGAGNDVMTGGSGDDVLFGEADSDYIQGMSGDDVLIGGNGGISASIVDQLFGGDGNDILIGGEMILGSNSGGNWDYAAFHALIQSWSFGGGGAGGVSGGLATNPSANIVDSSTEKDRMTGGAGNDWFILSMGDTVLDFTNNGIEKDYKETF